MSYAQDLANDRDRYRKQRNILMQCLHEIFSEHTEDEIKASPALKAAKAAWAKIDKDDTKRIHRLGL